MEVKIKHLEFIQNVIDRLSHKSFLIKNWSITTIAAICAFGVEKDNYAIFIIGILVCLLFWYLEAKYLLLERCFRKLYDDVRNDKVEEFSMKIKGADKTKDLLRTAFNKTIAALYVLELVLCAGGTVYYFIN